MATTADAEIILKLYELRREETMRKARAFVMFEFDPKSTAELLTVQRGLGSEHNAYWRQVTSYWDMAAGFCLRGAVDTDLFLDSNPELFFIYAKFADLYLAATGQPFMPQTAKLIDNHKAAKARHEAALKMFATRRAEAAAREAESESTSAA